MKQNQGYQVNDLYNSYFDIFKLYVQGENKLYKNRLAKIDDINDFDNTLNMLSMLAKILAKEGERYS